MRKTQASSSPIMVDPGGTVSSTSKALASSLMLYFLKIIIVSLQHDKMSLPLVPSSSLL